MSRTRLLITTVIVILGIYDGIAVMFGGVDVSISRLFSSVSSYPGPVFVLGYIAGHVFGWMTPTMPQAKRNDLTKLIEEMRGFAADTGNGSALIVSRVHIQGWAQRLEQIAGK